MIATIHQPQYLPWFGYFEKIAKGDVFILLDDVQFKKNEWQNRNKIRTPQGWQWLTVPVLHSFGQKICEVTINNQVKWRENHLKTIYLNYKKAPFFEKYIHVFEEIYNRPWKNISEINICFIKKLIHLLGISTKIVKSSEFNIATEKTQRLIDLCQIVGADTYLSGKSGPDYMDIDQFSQNNIKLCFQDYVHPKYEQLWLNKDKGFMSHLAVIDLLFNKGEESLDVLLGDFE